MLLPSSIQRADDFVGIATPTVPLSCACAAPSRPKAPRAAAANVVVNIFKVVLPLVHAQAYGLRLAQNRHLPKTFPSVLRFSLDRKQPSDLVFRAGRFHGAALLFFFL